MSDMLAKGVVYTHEDVPEYAKIECVGQYLLAAFLINSYFAPFREQIDILVDFGCGAGKSTRAVAPSVRNGGKIIGIDVSNEFLDEARSRAVRSSNNNNVNYEFAKIDVKGDTEIVHLNDAVADAVTSTIVMQEFQTEHLLRSALREISRIAKPRAKLALACVSDKITCEDYTTFTYAPYPENANREDNIRKCRSTVSSIFWENDRHWAHEIIEDELIQNGWNAVCTTYPLAGKELKPFPQKPELEWKDEARFAALMLITGEKGIR